MANYNPNTYFDRFISGNQKPKLGIAISTYSEVNTDSKRYEIIQKSFDSLISAILKYSDELYVFIVVDGSVPEIHNKLIEDFVKKCEYEYSRNQEQNQERNQEQEQKTNFHINVVKRVENGGVAKTKNTCIKLLLENKIDIGFLADDDLLYGEDCFSKYLEFIIKSRCHHLIACYPHPQVHPNWEQMGYVLTMNNGQIVRKHSGGVGYFLSITPQLIEKVGYFRILPGKFGFEHFNFTKRAIYHKMIPFPFDIDESVKYVEHIGFWPIAENLYGKCHSITNQTKVREVGKNKQVWKNNLWYRDPLIE